VACLSQAFLAHTAGWFHPRVSASPSPKTPAGLGWLDEVKHDHLQRNCIKLIFETLDVCVDFSVRQAARHERLAHNDCRCAVNVAVKVENHHPFVATACSTEG
jgi:hypothetical protein